MSVLVCLIHCDFCEKEETSSFLSAKLHGPIDNIKFVKKTLNLRGVIYKDGVVFLCRRSTLVRAVETESDILKISKNKFKTKSV